MRRQRSSILRCRRSTRRYAEVWQAEAGLKTYGQAVADVMQLRTDEGERFDMSVEQWLAFSKHASFYEARARAESMGIEVVWDCELPKTPEGFYQTPGRDRLCHRQIARCGAFRGYAVDGDQDGGPGGRRKDSRTQSTRNIPTKCWPTICRRRSTGTPRG